MYTEKMRKSHATHPMRRRDYALIAQTVKTMGGAHAKTFTRDGVAAILRGRLHGHARVRQGAFPQGVRGVTMRPFKYWIILFEAWVLRGKPWRPVPGGVHRV